MGTSLSIKKRVDTLRLRVELAIPPEKPEITGHLDVDYKILPKPEVTGMLDRDLRDEEFLTEVVVDVHGLGSPTSDDELTGQAAIDEVLTGHYSGYLVPAIVRAYVVHYGEARQGNSRKRR